MDIDQPVEDLEPADLVALGTSAHLAGDTDRAVWALQRAHRLQVDQGTIPGALQSAFLLGMIFGTTGQPSLFNGWLARAQRLLTELALDEDGARGSGRGYVAVLEMHRSLGAGEFASVGDLAIEVAMLGRKHRQPELLALGLVAQGRHAIYRGEVATGLGLLDEAMASVLAGEVDGLVTGLVWCAAIEGCQEIGAVDRMCQWTSGLHSWCADRPGLRAFAGECALHYGQVLTLHGSWVEAVEEFAVSRARYEQRGRPGAAGYADRERGDILRLRGDLSGAEAAYQAAAAYGCDPQPGLAQLWLGQGRHSAAVTAIRRCLTETPIPARRVCLLPAAIDIMLGASEVEQARALLGELDDLARMTGCDPVVAAASYAHALVELAHGDAAGALPYARKAVQVWSRVDCPFEVARSRVAIGRALREVGDQESARRDLEAARSVFETLGATPSVAEAAALLGAAGRAPAGLTSREVEVLRLVAEGRSNRQIATELVVSEKTVARHLSNIYLKLDVGSRTGAAAYAYEHGLVRLAPSS